MKRIIASVVIICLLLAALSVGVVATQVSVTHKSKGWIGLILEWNPGGDSTRYPVVTSVDPGSPAHGAGVLTGDTIVSFNGIDARNNSARLVQLIVPDTKITFQLRRGGLRKVSLSVINQTQTEITINPWLRINPIPTLAPILGRQNSRIASMVLQPRLSFMGADIADLDSNMARALRVKQAGVLIVGVIEKSPANEGDLKGGDVIFKIGKYEVSSISDFIQAVQNISDSQIEVHVVRNGKKQVKSLLW